MLFILGLVCLTLAGAQAAGATAVSARYQLRGHLPELGERPTMRVFQTQAAYDAYRNSLGDANVFPPASSLFMSFESDVLALYTRGNDSGGRCIASAVSAALDGNSVTANFQWQPGTCGAPITAHYPFILIAISRSASDGTAWVQPTRSVCGVVDSADTRACASLGGAASPSPTPAASPTSAPTATATAAATPTSTVTGSPTPARTVTPTTAPPPPTLALASPASTARPPAAVASPTTGADGAPGPELLVAGALVAVGLVLGLAIMAARRPRNPPGFRNRW